MWPDLGFNAPLQRSELLLIPAVVWAALAISRRYSARELSGSFLAYAWHFQSALVLSIVFLQLGLLDFPCGGHRFYGVPIELIAGQAILLGGVNALLLGHLAFSVRFAAGFVSLVAIYVFSVLVYFDSFWQLAAYMAVSVVPSLK